MVKKQLLPLSSAETEILQIIWKLGQGTVQQALDSLPGQRNIAYATVQTLLRRLEKKGYLAHEAKGRAYVFRAVVGKDSVLKSAVNGFLARLFGGDAAPLVQYLAENRHITAGDIEHLKTLLDKHRQ